MSLLVGSLNVSVTLGFWLLPSSARWRVQFALVWRIIYWLVVSSQYSFEALQEIACFVVGSTAHVSFVMLCKQQPGIYMASVQQVKHVHNFEHVLRPLTLMGLLTYLKLLGTPLNWDPGEEETVPWKFHVSQVRFISGTCQTSLPHGTPELPDGIRAMVHLVQYPVPNSTSTRCLRGTCQNFTVGRCEIIGPLH